VRKPIPLPEPDKNASTPKKLHYIFESGAFHRPLTRTNTAFRYSEGALTVEDGSKRMLEQSERALRRKAAKMGYALQPLPMSNPA
jgi:hypothetical protein